MLGRRCCGQGAQRGFALRWRQLAKRFRSAVKGGEITPLAREQRPERGDLLMIGGDTGQLGIVQVLCEPAIIAGIARPVLLELRVARLQFHQNTLLGGALGGITVRRGIDRSQLLTGGSGQRQKLLAALHFSGIFGLRARRAVLLQPALRAQLPDSGRKGFVKGGIVRDVQALMGQLVKQQFRQTPSRPADKGIQQRILEPAQR